MHAPDARGSAQVVCVRRSPIVSTVAKRLAAAACASGLLWAFAPSVLADEPAHDASPAARQASDAAQARATQLTTGLVRALKALERAPAAERAQRTREVVEVAIERRQAMLALVHSDPQRALALAVPAELRQKLPGQAAAQIEEPVRLEGRVVGMSIDDHARDTARHVYFLDTDAAGAAGRFVLHWADPAMSERDTLAMIDKRVRVKALRIDGQLIVGARSEVELAASGAGGKKASGSGEPSGASADGSTADYLTGTLVSGEQRTLVILASFSDRATSCTTTGVRSSLFGTGTSVDRIYRESSGNQVTFAGDVVGPFTIPYSASGTCDFNAWGSAADAAARAAGVDPSRYARISYSVPPNSNCGWTGVAYVGGSPPTRSWVAQCTAGLFAHEIGHNLRFKHASTPTSTYGDASDPMGSARAVQMHAANRVMAGWIGASGVVDVVSSGNYAIAALEAPDTGMPQAIRLPKASTNEFYYVSLRQAAGLDANLSTAYQNVVTVHRATGVMPSVTVLLARLAAGQSYEDTTNGIRITAQAIATGSASVGIQTTAAACARSAPAVSLSPSSQSAAAGASLRYSLSITNRNSSSCGDGVFALGQTLPSGFAGAFASPSVTLAPAATTTVSWSVTSAAQAPDGVYALRASAGESGSTATASSASYVVYSDGSAPTVSVTWPQDGAVLPSKPVSLSATAFDAGGIERVDFLMNGSIVGTAIATPYQVRWNPRKASGQQTLTARATDRSGNSSEAMVRFTLK